MPKKRARNTVQQPLDEANGKIQTFSPGKQVLMRRYRQRLRQFFRQIHARHHSRMSSQMDARSVVGTRTCCSGLNTWCHFLCDFDFGDDSHRRDVRHFTILSVKIKESQELRIKFVLCYATQNFLPQVNTGTLVKSPTEALSHDTSFPSITHPFRGAG